MRTYFTPDAVVRIGSSSSVKGYSSIVEHEARNNPTKMKKVSTRNKCFNIEIPFPTFAYNDVYNIVVFCLYISYEKFRLPETRGEKVILDFYSPSRKIT